MMAERELRTQQERRASRASMGPRRRCRYVARCGIGVRVDTRRARHSGRVGEAALVVPVARKRVGWAASLAVLSVWLAGRRPSPPPAALEHLAVEESSCRSSFRIHNTREKSRAMQKKENYGLRSSQWTLFSHLLGWSGPKSVSHSHTPRLPLTPHPTPAPQPRCPSPAATHPTPTHPGPRAMPCIRRVHRSGTRSGHVPSTCLAKLGLAGHAYRIVTGAPDIQKGRSMRCVAVLCIDCAWRTVQH